MYAYDMPIKCTWNKNKILRSQSNYLSSINATIYLQLQLSALMLPVRPVYQTGQTGPYTGQAGSSDHDQHRSHVQNLPINFMNDIFS